MCFAITFVKLDGFWTNLADCFLNKFFIKQCKQMSPHSVKMLPYLTALFVLFWQQNNSVALVACVSRVTTKNGLQLFWGKILATPMPRWHSASVAPNVKSWLCPWLWVTWLEDFLTWLLYCAGAITGNCVYLSLLTYAAVSIHLGTTMLVVLQGEPKTRQFQ